HRKTVALQTLLLVTPDGRLNVPPEQDTASASCSNSICGSFERFPKLEVLGPVLGGYGVAPGRVQVGGGALPPDSGHVPRRVLQAESLSGGHSKCGTPLPVTWTTQFAFF